MFPIPLTILLLRKKDMKPAVKYGIIALAWVLFFAAGMIGGSNADVSQSDTLPTYNESVQGETSETTNETESLDIILNSYIADIVILYNADVSEKLVFVEDFIPSNKESGHYRTEFRLAAYEDAVGKSYLLGDKVVDIVASQTILGGNRCRVYTNDTSLEQVISLIKGFSPILDKELKDEDLQNTIEDISTAKTANGYYFGSLGITLFGADETGYAFMLKND